MRKTIKGRWGDVTFFPKDEYVGRSLWYYGEYNPDETECILSLADKSKVTLDIGANIGVISQALEYNGHTVIAFEPQIEVFNLLSRNVKGEAHNCAVGAEEGVVELPKVYYSDKGNFGGVSVNTRSIYGSYKRPMVTIDSLFPNCPEEYIGLMKIDVEGYELQVLQGAVETIRRCRPILYVEDDRVANSRVLRGYITSLGYSIEEHDPPLYREDNFFKCKKNVWDRNYVSKNIICKPI